VRERRLRALLMRTQLPLPSPGWKATGRQRRAPDLVPALLTDQAHGRFDAFSGRRRLFLGSPPWVSFIADLDCLRGLPRIC
jgi:hypothetical protein